MATGEYSITGTAEHPFGIAGDDVGRLVEILCLVDDAIAQQKAVDRFQRNARNGIGHRRAADSWRKLDCAPGSAAIEGQAWLTVDVNQRQRIARIDEIGVFDLWIGLPKLRPFPRFTQVFSGNVPECVPCHHGVLLWKNLP